MKRERKQHGEKAARAHACVIYNQIHLTERTQITVRRITAYPSTNNNCVRGRSAKWSFRMREKKSFLHVPFRADFVVTAKNLQRPLRGRPPDAFNSVI